MAGAILLSEDKIWSAAGWLFDWALRFVAQEVGDPRLTATVDEIIRENLGLLDVDRLPGEVRQVILRKLADDLVPVSAVTLPGGLSDRESVLRVLDELARLARDVSGARS
jgi:hypothetical protein